MTYNLGQLVGLSTVVTDANGIATDATVTLTVTRPDGTAASPTTPSHDGTGLYSSTVTVNQVGTWFVRWDAAGAILDNERSQFNVSDPKPPAYATVPDLRSAIGVDSNARDTRLLNVLLSASRSIDRATGRRFWLDAATSARIFSIRDRVVYTHDGPKFLVDDIGSTTGLVVALGVAGAFTAITDYSTSPDNALVKGDPITGLIRPFAHWSYGRGYKVQITAQWGYPWIPDEIAEATLLQANRFYKRRDSPEGVLGTAEWGAVRVSRVDPDVMAMIGSHVLPGIG